MDTITSVTIGQPGSFFDKVGGLHDVRIDKLVIDPDEEGILLSTTDLLANFEGLDGYPGEIPSKIAFHSVHYIRCGLSFEEGFRISHTVVSANSSRFLVHLFLNLGVLDEDLSISPIQIECEAISVLLHPDEKAKLETFLRAQ